MCIAEISSPFFKDVLPGPIGIFSTASILSPVGPIIETVAPAAIWAGTLSAAGDPLQRFPTIVALP